MPSSGLHRVDRLRFLLISNVGICASVVLSCACALATSRVVVTPPAARCCVSFRLSGRSPRCRAHPQLGLDTRAAVMPSRAASARLISNTPRRASPDAPGRTRARTRPSGGSCPTDPVPNSRRTRPDRRRTHRTPMEPRTARHAAGDAAEAPERDRCALANSPTIGRLLTRVYDAAALTFGSPAAAAMSYCARDLLIDPQRGDLDIEVFVSRPAVPARSAGIVEQRPPVGIDRRFNRFADRRARFGPAEPATPGRSTRGEPEIRAERGAAAQQEKGRSAGNGGIDAPALHDGAPSRKR